MTYSQESKMQRLLIQRLSRSKIQGTLKKYGYKKSKANAKTILQTIVEASTIIKATTAVSKDQADWAETKKEE